MNTTDPIIARMRETGTSKGMLMTRATMSHAVTSAMPPSATHGRF